MNFCRQQAGKRTGGQGGRPSAAAQIAPTAPALALAVATQNGPGGQGVQLEETAAVDMAIDVHIKEPDDRTRGMQYIIILYDVRIKFFI